MQAIYRKWRCHRIIANDKYIVAFGDGVTVLDRTTYAVCHHFTGIRYIHGGIFVDENVLAVFTGEQKLFFLDILEKTVFWNCPRPRLLATNGDMLCCRVPGTKKVACIAMGKHGLSDHILLIADYEQQSVKSYEIPNCCNVVKELRWREDIGLTFLTYHATDRKDLLLYKIIRIEESGNSSVLLEWTDSQKIRAYSERYLFSSSGRYLTVSQMFRDPESKKHAMKQVQKISLPTFHMQTLLSGVVEYSPLVFWADEEEGFLVACSDRWVGAYDFHSGRLIAEKDHSNISYGTVIDRKFVIGCSPGLWVTCLPPSTGDGLREPF